MPKKQLKHNGSEQAAEFMISLEHPLKKEIEEVRSIILAACGRLTEHIKWNAPSFCINGEDRITFNLRGKDSFRLIFHRGAKVREGTGKEPLFPDETGLLEWAAPDRAIAVFTDMEDVMNKRGHLEEIVKTWIERTE
ncbi:DUF1801 domain-containing protein [Metabacillus sp. KIGAM252]|uniref:DUF1801 domain-containing protein n=1 Tax=Metabacillus flavus TaxID=2823519 RepID=A0ABS5LAY3_9BACI|nr:DUF1801 domain-containing protein [Metabacillus flavus]MBS2967882.1 DUF1801 domain-containing protein [Metabacillus flavus]